LFPELAISGYPPRDLVERPAFVARSRESLDHIAAETADIAVICGLVTPAHAETGKSVMNSAALTKDGKVAFVQSKSLLPTYDVFDESRNFAAARKQELFDFCGKRVALTICEDAWNDKHFWNKRLYGFDPVEALIREGGNLLLNIGPRSDGSISDIQMDRLTHLGAWLDRNGEGIFDSRPWVKASSAPEIRFTQKSRSLYAYVQPKPGADSITIPGVRVAQSTGVRILGTGKDTPFKQEGQSLTVSLPAGSASKEYALCARITPIPESV